MCSALARHEEEAFGATDAHVLRSHEDWLASLTAAADGGAKHALLLVASLRAGERVRLHKVRACVCMCLCLH